MSEEDALISVQKHATSKISNEEDLDRISTLGFRGEALSSILAVSQFEMKTGTTGSELSTIIKSGENGVLIKENGGYFKGTDISVKNLFYNTPARRNFLKTDQTELKYIIDTFNKLAIGNHHIRFKLYLEDTKIYDYAPGALDDRLIQVFGKNIAGNIMPLNERTEYISLHGYIGKPNLVKKSKAEQYTYLNGRFVNSKVISHSVFTAYENVLEKGEYPFFVLFIDIDPFKIDVNVHPSKLEVRFDEEKEIYNFVLAVSRKSLGDFDLVPSLTFGSQRDNSEVLKFDDYKPVQKRDFSDRPPSQPSKTLPKYSDEEIDHLFNSINLSIKSSNINPELPHPFDEQNNENEQKEETQPQTVKRIEHAPGEESHFYFQLHNKYILTQIKSGLMIIDQHVAHERILYEKALKQLEERFPVFQPVLFPREVTTDPATVALLKEIYSYIENLGFQLKFINKISFVIESVPTEVTQGEEEKILLGIAEEFTHNRIEKKLEDADNAAKSYSCRAAIKTGDKLSQEEMRVLIDELFATSMPYYCPHGRPTVVKLSIDEFDRRFGRTS